MAGGMADVAPGFAAKLHIMQIRRNKFSIGKKDPNPLTGDLHHAVSSLSAELYTKDVHFLMELIQNAEDNEYPDGVEPTLEFVLTKRDIAGVGAPETLVIFNNEVGFSKQNINSICSVGISTKKGKRKFGFIGEKGIGFKSVFLVSKCPYIFSNGYHIRFSEEPDKDCGIGYIVPEWVDTKAHLSDIHDLYGSDKALPTTIFLLPLKPDKVEAVRAQLSELHPELLLFLSKIKRLFVRDSNNDPKDSYVSTVVSMCSETDHVKLRDKRAESRKVKLSVKEKMSAEETHRYFMWKQSFPVKSENRVSARLDVEEWIVTLAFPYGKRLGSRTSSVGIFAFLPTAMITNFPFVIQADFILASSRETILLDNKWNLGILECIPSAFFDAFNSCLKSSSTTFPQLWPFNFLPAKASPIPDFNNVRSSIRGMLQRAKIVPCENFYGEKFVCFPSSAIRILPEFRKLLVQTRSQGALLDGLSSLKKYVLHSSLDLEHYSAILDFLGVATADVIDDWYAACINACNLSLLASEDLYMELLCFIADRNKILFNDLPLLRYINREGKVELCCLSKVRKQVLRVQYALHTELHEWLNKCNIEFGFPDSFFFLPNSTQRALISHRRFSFLQNWLLSNAGMNHCSACDYEVSLLRHVADKKDQKLAVKLAQFLYHSHKKNFIPDYDLSRLCRRIPIIDGSGHLRTVRLTTLACASKSKWVKLLGPLNPFVQHNYIDIGKLYAESGQFAGEYTPGNVLLSFLSEHSGAVDLDRLNIPNTALEVASSALTCDQAFLLLDWIRCARSRASSLPDKFFRSVSNGKWLKTYSGFNSPSHSILPDDTGKAVLKMMINFLEDLTIIDQEFYINKIGLYADELKYLGVVIGLGDVQKLLMNCTKNYASSELSKEQAFSLLMFLNYLESCNILDEGWLMHIKGGKWLRTSQGYRAPASSVLLKAELAVEDVLSITNIPVIDENYYGSQITCFSSALAALGVVSDMEGVWKMIAENMVFPLNTSMNANNVMLILKCIRYSGSASSALVDKIRDQPWVKTSSGTKCPIESVLPDFGWKRLLNGIKLPIIDEAFYGDEIRSFIAELKAIGVAVELDNALKLIVARFKSLASSSILTPANIYLLLNGIRQLNNSFQQHLPEVCNSLSVEEWLKTRHGYKPTGESILSDSKWAAIAFFIDLPLVDDSFYGIGIYAYRNELRLLGVITDFAGGAAFVARGVTQPFDTSLVNAEGTIALLESIRIMMSHPDNHSLLANFVETLRRTKLMKTNIGYKMPEECVLFDATWDGFLFQTDVPAIDQTSYPVDLSLYKNQLRFIGVQVDSWDVCSLLCRLLFALTDTDAIRRVYTFLSKFYHKPESVNECSSQVWVPSSNSSGGKWVSSQVCVVHDSHGLFDSQFYVLDKYYAKELWEIFSSAFGVAEFPSVKDYLQLWQSWVSRANRRITSVECCSFWVHVLENWSSCTEKSLNQALTHVPAIMCSSEDIYLVRKEDAFIPDDLQLQKVFSSAYRIPLFVWSPATGISPSVSPRRLCGIYHSLGVRRISQSIEYISSHVSLDNALKVDPRDALIGKGLVKIILAFLRGCEIQMSQERRHRAAKSLLDLSIYECENPIHVSYGLVTSEDMKLEVKKKKMVFWQKSCQQMLVDKSGYEDRKNNIEFSSCFAQEIAQKLLAEERADLAQSLSDIIQMALAFEFREDAVDFLLAKANMVLFKEDEEFLASHFSCSGQSAPIVQSRTRSASRVLGPSTPQASLKKQRKY